MLQFSHNKLILLVVAVLFGITLRSSGRDNATQRFGLSKFDATVDCVRDVFGKPVVWEFHGLTTPLQSCTEAKPDLQDSLTRAGIRVMDAGAFTFLVNAQLFQPQPARPFSPPPLPPLKWTDIKVTLHLQTIHEDELMPKDAQAIAGEILKSARLIPLSVYKLDAEGYPKKGALDVDLNIALWQGQLGPAKDESVVAIIHGRPLFSTARLVYGEIKDGKYSMQWDSPLFNVLHADIEFQDVNGDGWKEVVIESTNYGNREYPMMVIFDRSGHELTRQKKCNTDIAADNNFTEEDGTCAIFGSDIELSGDAQDSQNGDDKSVPTAVDINVSDWDGQVQVFKLVNGLYAPSPATRGSVAPKVAANDADPRMLNLEGIRLLRTGKYDAAELKFQRASDLTGNKNAEYANNLGFALFKEEKYELSVPWFKKAIDLDHGRAVAYLNLGDALVKLNRKSEARDAYNKYLQLAPDSKAAPAVRDKLSTL